MRYLILTAVALSLSAPFAGAEEAAFWRGCGAFEDYRIELFGADDLGDGEATAACGANQDAEQLAAGCTRVIDESTDDKVLVNAGFNRALARIVLDDLDGAIADLDRLLPSDSDSDAYDLRGLAYYCRGDLDRALAEFNAALAIWPENDSALSDRARLYLAQNEPDRAYADAIKAAEIEPENATAQVVIGVVAEQRGDMKGAALAYDEALDIEFYCDCVEIDYDGVEDAYDRVYAAASDQLLADCRTGQGATAIAGCTQYLDLGGVLSDKQEATAHLLRADAHFAARDFDNAIADFDRAIELDPKSIAGYMGRGAARALSKDFDGAIADFTAASNLAPENPSVLADRGRTFILKGDLASASTDIAAALALDPNHAVALALRGFLHEQRDEPDEALADFEAALAIDPGLPMALEGRERLKAH
ncbi:MAG: tetratricopeptide repeat protein [Bauldia sp.]